MKSRRKKTYINTAMSLLQELVGIVCGLILPRLILQHFGSAYNGIVASITQFLSCVTLLRAGLGGVTRAALYKPLAEGDQREISRVVFAARGFMKKVSYIFFGLLIAFAFIYPFIVLDQFEWLFSFGLVLILGISTIFECYFGIAYQFLLQADQKRYVIAAARICALILNTSIAALLISLDCSIYEVKLGSALVFSVQPLFIYWYVRRHYRLEKPVDGEDGIIAQRWDAFAHQVAAFVTTNTDVIVLTIFSDIKTVSVYSVHNMVVSPIKNLVVSAANGMEAAFGDMIAKNETETLRRSFSQFEFFVFFISTALFSCTGVLISPFLKVYTAGVEDVNYWRPFFGVLMCVAQFLACIRLPYQTIVETAGRFRETRNGAIVEASINIVVSVLLVQVLGLVGVLAGTIISLAFRTTQYVLYVNRTILGGVLGSYIRGLIFSLLSAAAIAGLSYLAFGDGVVAGYAGWVVHGFCVAGISAAVLLVAGLLAYPVQMKNMALRLRSLLGGKLKKNRMNL